MDDYTKLKDKLSGWGNDNGDGQPRTLLSESWEAINTLERRLAQAREEVIELKYEMWETAAGISI